MERGEIMSFNCGDNIKDLRKEFGFTQKDLECPGLERSIISRIERGEKDLTNDRAQMLSRKINGILKQKNIKINYEITPEFLMGIKEDDIDNLINNFKNGYSDAFDKINNFLTTCNSKLAEKLLDKLLDELVKNIKKYSEETKDYCNRLLGVITDKKKITETSITLIAAHLASKYSEKYESMVSISKRIEDSVKYASKQKQISFYNNMSTAYRNLKQYDKALRLIREGKKIKDNPHLFGILNTEAIIYIDLKHYKKAKNIYLQIISKSENPNFIANSLSNLADIFNTEGDLTTANLYINKAFKYIDQVDDLYKYNLYYVKLQIKINQGENILNSLKQCLILCKKLDRIKSEKPINIASEYFIKNNNKECKEIIEMLFLLKNETKASLIMDILPYITSEATRKMAYEIPRY